VWTEVLQDSFLDLFDSGNLDFATATSIRFSPGGFQRFYDGVSQTNHQDAVERRFLFSPSSSFCRFVRTYVS
jgi:acyl-CoA hydrolase